MLDFDKILLEIGEFGRYQQIVMWLLTIPGCLMNAFNGYVLVFLMYKPDHKCVVGENYINFTVLKTRECDIILSNGTSNFTTKCSQWQYDKQYFESTMITEWNLVCDRAVEPKTTQAVIAATTVIGCLIYSYVQDQWGRKIAFLINTVTYVIGASVSLLMPNLLAFSIVRQLSALNAISSWNISYTWAMEYVGPSKRTLLTTIYCVVYAISMMSMSLIAYLCSTWIQMGWITSLPFAFLLSYQFLIEESPRWLITQGRNEEAIGVIRKMARGQKQIISEEKLLNIIRRLTEDESTPETPPPVQHQTVTLLDLFKTPNLRAKTLLMTFAWIANAVVYTSLAYNTENLGGNLYMTWMILSAVEAPATILNLFILDRFGRIWPLCLAMCLSGLFCLLTSPGEQYLPTVVIIILAILGKFFICVSYAIIYQVACELFPTIIRGLGIGFSSVIADAANISMPYIILSAQAYKMLPMVVMGILAVTGGVVSLFLPETLNQPLPETVCEGEQRGIAGFKSFRNNLACARYKLDKPTNVGTFFNQPAQHKENELL